MRVWRLVLSIFSAFRRLIVDRGRTWKRLMHPIFFSAILLVICSTARAEWTEFGKNINAILYIDKSTLTRNGNITTVRSLADYYNYQISPKKTKYYSRISINEFDCANKKYRIIESTRYTGQMGAGSPVFTSEKPKWEFWLLGSIYATRGEAICRMEPSLGE